MSSKKKKKKKRMRDVEVAVLRGEPGGTWDTINVQIPLSVRAHARVAEAQALKDLEAEGVEDVAGVLCYFIGEEVFDDE